MTGRVRKKVKEQKIKEHIVIYERFHIVAAKKNILKMMYKNFFLGYQRLSYASPGQNSKFFIVYHRIHQEMCQRNVQFTSNFMWQDSKQTEHATGWRILFI